MKIVIGRIDEKTSRSIGADRTAAVRQRVKTNGQVRNVWKLDIGSDDFVRDLTYVFGMNVARARRENKRIIGSADGRSTDR